MTTSSYIILFILGLIFGSFLNVVIFRYTPEKSLFDVKKLKGRSKCMSCLKQLSWYELIPLVSFIIQRKKCRGCGSSLSWQYFLVELATGFIFLIPAWLASPLVSITYVYLASIVWILILLGFLLVWVIDYRLNIIPNELNLTLAILGIILVAIREYYDKFGAFAGSFVGSYAALFGMRENIWANHFFGALVGFLIIGLIVFLTKTRGMGVGDLKLAVVLGLIFGWPDVFFILIFSFIIGALFSLYLLISGKKTFKEAVPFGPFLVIGSLAAMFFGEAILSAYFKFFNLF
ncbi:MAG: prepilin peptidase [Candidatus Pacebacteria bacterium]|nr:prepilin peptidase [Candidatus Paceibacterota bacterium]